MPYNCSNQRECWLECCMQFFATPPRFRLGQAVEAVWVDDSTGREYRDRGFVIGVFTNWPGHNSPGWWYVVFWNPLESESSIAAGSAGEAHEDELKTVEEGS